MTGRPWFTMSFLMLIFWFTSSCRSVPDNALGHGREVASPTPTTFSQSASPMNLAPPKRLMADNQVDSRSKRLERLFRENLSSLLIGSQAVDSISQVRKSGTYITAQAAVLLVDDTGSYGAAYVEVADPHVTFSLSECAPSEHPCNIQANDEGFVKVLDYRTQPRSDQGTVFAEAYGADKALRARVVVVDTLSAMYSKFLD